MDQSYWSPTKCQTARAATAIHNILVFKRMIDREELPPLLLRNTIPICMAQYAQLLSSIRYRIQKMSLRVLLWIGPFYVFWYVWFVWCHRVPGEVVDELRHYDSTVSKHIVVNYLGVYYRVECYDVKNQILSPAALQAQFEWIMRDAETQLKSGRVQSSKSYH